MPKKARTPALIPSARKPRGKSTSNAPSEIKIISPHTATGTTATALFSPNGQPPEGAPPANKSAEIAEKIKELVRLAQEQGYLTYGDINDALPDTLISADELDDIYIKLRGLDVEIVDQAEVDRVKQPEQDEEEDKTRLDIL